MKKILALLTLTTLLACSVMPAVAGYWDRAPIKQWCIKTYNGSYETTLKTVDCYPQIGRSCLPETCLLPPKK